MSNIVILQSDLEAALDGVEGIDWSDAELAYPACSAIFDRVLAERGLLRDVVMALATGRLPHHDCESYEEMDKLVLWQSPDRSIRLRLHVFPPGYAGRPHPHRWSFASRMLAGHYHHSLYGRDDEVLDRVRSGQAPPVRYEHKTIAGSEYFVDSSVVHSIATNTRAATLVLRGPSLTDSYFSVIDPGSRSVRWNRGAADEPEALRREKSMTADDFARVVDILEELDVI
jgi:hypothetical protein